MKIFFSILILFLLYLAANPQLHSQFSNPGSITWERTYENQYTNLINWDGGWDVCEADSGNFYIAGHTIIHGGTGGYRMWLLKINPYGDTIWTRIIMSNQVGSIARACAPSPDGGCVVTGDGLPFTIKFDRNGNIVWTKSYGNDYTQAYRIINTSDGGYAACGRLFPDSAIVFKVDSLGNLEWLRKFGSNNYKHFEDLKEDKGDFILTGNVVESNFNIRIPFLQKINSKGNLIWEKRYDKLYRAFTTSVDFLKDQYLIGGGIRDSSDTRSLGYIIRTDTSGNILYSKEFYSIYSGYFTDISIINENKYVTCGYQYFNHIFEGFFHGRGLIIDSLGNILHEKNFPTPDFMELRSVLSISNGDIIFTGVVDFDSISTREKVYAVRTDSMLNYSPLGISSNTNVVPSDFKLYPAYPNPFNPVTKLKFEIPRKEDVSIKIFDITGREILEILNQQLPTGQHTLEWNASSQSSGVYFAVLHFENMFVQSQKLILIK